MKKYILATAIAVVAMSALTSCDKDTEGLTWTTFYPQLTLEGETYGEWQMGVPYVDPGYSAMSAGEDITSEVKVTTTMNFSDPAPGYYKISYSVTNADGNSSTAARYVLVADPTDPASGYYYTNPASYRDYNGKVYFGRSFMITVIGNGDGTYNVSDLIGGWYAQRAGYGSNYAMPGKIAIAADGAITMLSSYVPGWGDEATGMYDGFYDAATSTISWTVEYTDYPFFFYVEMSK